MTERLHASAVVRMFRYAAAPASFYPLAGSAVPWFALLAALLAAAGVYVGLVLAPADSQYGDSVRIVFIHLPAAWMSMWMFLMMAGWAAIGLLSDTRLFAMFARSIAPTGALMTMMALWTGALLGRPAWGTWWVWDARQTTGVLLLALYLAFIALPAAIDDPRRADRAAAALAVAGAIGVPLIYFSVQWWISPHYAAAISSINVFSINGTMLAGVVMMLAAFWMYCFALPLARVRSVILERERDAEWAAHAIGADR